MSEPLSTDEGPAPWPPVEAAKCGDCGKVRDDTITRINLLGLPKLCGSCFIEKGK